MKTLTTERLKLRLVSVDDAPFILDLYNHPDFYRFVGDKQIRTATEAAIYIRNNILHMQDVKGVSLLLVEKKDNAEPIGICGLVKRDTLKDYDLGYGFIPSAYGHGYGLEAAKEVLTYAKEELKLKKLVAITNDDNHRSIHLLKKLGFKFERVEQKYDNGRTLELYVTAL